MTDVVLDSVTVNALARPTRGKPAREDHLTRLVRTRHLRVVADKKRKLIDEWAGTASQEVVRQLIVQWDSGFKLVEEGRLKTSTKNALRELGFRDAGDKLVLRIAVRTTDRIVVTSDSDFWDPGDKSKRGDKSAPVAQLLHEEEEINVVELASLLARFDVR